MTTQTTPPPPAHTRHNRTTRPRRTIAVLVSGGVLLVLLAASLFIGSNAIAPGPVLAALTGDPAADPTVVAVVIEQRVPRTILLVLCGAALAVAGALMQTLTRNPLADPGLMGINAGSSLAVVAAVAYLGVSTVFGYLWFALAGAALAAVAVFALGGMGRPGVGIERLALAGVAVSMAVGAIVQAVILTNQEAFNEFRFWAAGSAENRGLGVAGAVVGFIVVGLVIALLATPALNGLALGEDTARALGVNVALTRALVALAVTLLAGAATAAIGPIMFVGLGVPYLARAVCGADIRRALPYSLIAGPAALLAADIVARVIIAPQEIQVGIMTALIGGPIFVALLRRPRLEAL